MRRLKSAVYWGSLVGVWIVFGGIAFLLFVAPYFGLAWKFAFPG